MIKIICTGKPNLYFCPVIKKIFRTFWQVLNKVLRFKVCNRKIRLFLDEILFKKIDPISSPHLLFYCNDP